MKTRGGKAHRNAFIDILAEVKQMLRHLHPCIQQMPKIERMDKKYGLRLKNKDYKGTKKEKI